MESGYSKHFSQIAGSYDALREESTSEVVRWIIDAGRFAAGQSFIDIGCGTGATTVALARTCGLSAVGVDPSSEMLQTASQHESDVCRFVRAHAEELPFGDRSFDRALMQTAVHLMRRPDAFAEAQRVLRENGLLVIFTVDPAGVDDFWLAEWFPSYPAIDRERFPTEQTLVRELRDAGFRQVKTRRRARGLRFTRERGLAMLRARFASSFALMSDEEYEAGLQRAEQEMPEAFESTLMLLILTAAIAPAS
jgi:SAM-dependent methyltransferase